jgi:hypothetical protein
MLDRKTYRNRIVRTQIMPHRQIAKAYCKRIMRPRSLALLDQIHSEIATPVELLPGLIGCGFRNYNPEIGDEMPVQRRKGANRRKTEQKEAKKLADFALSGDGSEYGIGGFDIEAEKQGEFNSAESADVSRVFTVQPLEGEGEC